MLIYIPVKHKYPLGIAKERYHRPQSRFGQHYFFFLNKKTCMSLRKSLTSSSWSRSLGQGSLGSQHKLLETHRLNGTTVQPSTKEGAGHQWGSTPRRSLLSTPPVIVHLEFSFRVNAPGPQEHGARGQVKRYLSGTSTHGLLALL